MFGEKNTNPEEVTVAHDILDSNTYANLSSNLDEKSYVNSEILTKFYPNIEDTEQHERYVGHNKYYEKSIIITGILFIISVLVTIFFNNLWIIFLLPILYFTISHCLLKLEFEKYNELESATNPTTNKLRCVYCGHTRFRVFPTLQPNESLKNKNLKYSCNSCHKFLFYKRFH